MRKLETPFSKNINLHHILEDYPRPQIVRDSYMNLNGIWDY